MNLVNETFTVLFWACLFALGVVMLGSFYMAIREWIEDRSEGGLFVQTLGEDDERYNEIPHKISHEVPQEVSQP